MKTIPQPAGLLDTIKTFDTFVGIPDADLQWLLDQCTYQEYEQGEVVFRPGEAVDSMMIVVEGRYILYEVRDNEHREFGQAAAGAVTGVLPFSRLTSTGAEARTVTKTRTLAFHKSHFTDMVNQSYPLTQNLVAVMSDRIRNFSQTRFQTEKLMALGKISAGLAHELNNPASSIVRNAEELYAKMRNTPDSFKAVMTLNITPEETDQMNAILFARIEEAKQNPLDLSFMKREEKKDDLLDWLEDHEVATAEDISDTFVDFGLNTDDLDKVKEILGTRDLETILNWFENRFSLETIVSEIREASGRIADLVKSVKTYTHMDQGAGMEKTDIHEGLRSTLVMLKSKLKEKNIRVERDFDKDLPEIPAYVSELNQVWTNLISNAADAMDKEGTLILRTSQDREFVCAEVEDNGSGIPEATITRIWEPFFTTKAMGEGTGMGLDIVKKILDKHNAHISVNSEPGKTVFSLCFSTTPPQSGKG